MSLATRPLPPGKFGLPVIGQMATYFRNPFQFIEDGVADYGPVFKSRLMLHKTAVITGPEACERFIDPSLIQRRGAIPKSVEWLFGGPSLPFQDGVFHERNKEIVMSAFSADALASYLPDMQSIVEAHFRKWVGQGEFRWLDGLKQLAFEIIATNLLGPLNATELTRLQNDYESLAAGLVSLPVPLPNTNYGKALEAKQHALQVIERLVSARKQSPKNDGLSRILTARSSDGQNLSDEEARLETHHAIIAGFVVFGHLASVILFATREADVRKKLAAAVASLPPGTQFTAPALGGIHYLQQFVAEVKRLSPIIPVVFGKAKRDFELNGVRIPAGWLVLWALRSSNIYHPSFPDRYKFDPNRYAPYPGREQELHDRLVYVPQSGGAPLKSHACAGFDYSALLASVFTVILLRDHDWQLRNADPEYNWRLNPPQPVDGLMGRVTFSSSTVETP